MTIPVFASSVGPGKLTIELGETTFNLKLTLDQGGVYFENNVAVNWSPQVLVQFGIDAAILTNWAEAIALPPKFDNAPVAITRIGEKELQIRVGYDRTPNSLIFKGTLKLDTTGVPTTKPPHQRSLLLEKGKRITLTPSNFPTMRVGHVLFGLVNRNPESTNQWKKDCTFIVEPGLLGADEGFISLRSVNYPNHYVNHWAFALNLSAKTDELQYKQNASFFPAVGSSGDSTVTFYSLNFQQFTIRHFLHRHVLNQKENNSTFNQDSSFKVSPGLWTGAEGL